MKYILLVQASQRAHDELARTPDTAEIEAFMLKFNADLEASGEFVDAQGLAAPVHRRRVEAGAGAPVVTDGPYPETQEVLAGYWIVDCSGFDRATEIAAILASGPGPKTAIDVRPIAGSEPEL
ncbi:YciI family protein [Amycolatopsis suaedae]|uniref:YCII-related domain-containing protein n=1 Tax=Amycolatopsis suaedae TaxID=2510978 RepID=A0A4Q7J105_9PSEU|nr:YciI family protein [Amycolatopsis suaedae]RZQ60499.1 hypothetical protein EWH70_27845 [Amycolatopsis suaedae]